MATEPKEMVAELLKLMGFDDAKVVEKDFDAGMLLDIETDEAGRLIGRQGATLADMQYLLNRLLFRQDQDAPKVTLDVGGYRSKARETLVAKAKEAADRVRKQGDIVELEPMNSFDRWVVHNTLKDDEEIETSSVEVDGTSMKAILLRPKRG
ncbi:MAG: single-stranded DNA-binding protein [Verrucomicrobiales bacterium]|nr:single-stranded DNA-binding protein [Verrucomicrobiales bacterium]|tara:strand:+ start:11903 stop:12358 length:456 start_codon:yes stop_codon:yes gene_type:complete